MCVSPMFSPRSNENLSNKVSFQNIAPSVNSCAFPSISEIFEIENICPCVFTSSLCPWHTAGLMTAVPQIFAKVASLVGGQENGIIRKKMAS